MNHGIVNEGVHLGNNMPLLAHLYHVDFVVNEGINLLPQAQGSHYQLVPHWGLAIAAEQVKKGGSINAKFVVSRHQAQICVQLGGAIVVVTGTKMHITLNAIVFFAHNEDNFGVGLKAYQAVNYMAASLFQAAGPQNIIFLVKAGL